MTFLFSSVNISTTDSDPAKKMDLPPGFVVSNESVDEINNDDLQIANQASLSQTQIIIIGGAGGGCLLIILGTSISLNRVVNNFLKLHEKATKFNEKIPPCFEITLWVIFSIFLAFTEYLNFTDQLYRSDF